MNLEKDWWQQDVFAKKLPFLTKRSQTISSIRDFFIKNNFLEVETPALQACPGMEVHTKFFETLLESQFNDDAKKLYLHTSPEFAMKKLLVAGLNNIFQLARVFRNAEVSSHHYPEFTMLEWYRTYSDYTAIMDDCEKLIKAAAPLCGNGLMSFNSKTCNPNLPCIRISVASLFEKYTAIDLNKIIRDGLNPDAASFAQEATKIGIYIPDNYSFDDIFFKIFMEKIEPFLGVDAPTIVYDYPLCMGALARKKPSDERFAERFELYICGLELANAFSELTDANEQKSRFLRDMELKKELYGKFCYPDDDFLKALEYGMPESAGIALGIDRLVMLVCGADNIEDVLWTPIAL